MHKGHSILKRFIVESREYQLVAQTDKDKEEYSSWYDTEDKVLAVKDEIDSTDKYVSTTIVKRIKEKDAEYPEGTLEKHCNKQKDDEEEPSEKKDKE